MPDPLTVFPRTQKSITLAWELGTTFLAGRFSGAKRHFRRLAKVAEVENQEVLL
jgi:hypothetical protein